MILWYLKIYQKITSFQSKQHRVLTLQICKDMPLILGNWKSTNGNNTNSMIINDIHFHSITRYKRYIDSGIYKRLSASTLTRQQNTNIEAEPSRLAQPKNYHKSHYLQGVPPICWQVQTKFWKLKNYMSQKVSPVLKFLGKKLLDSTLKLGKIKLEVILNWISKKVSTSQKEILPCPSLPPPSTTTP